MIKPNINIIFTLFFIALTLSCISQNILVIEKHRAGRNIKFYQNDRITVELKYDQTVLKGRLTTIGDSSFILNEKQEIYLNNIERVYIERFWPKLLEGVCFAAGIPYLAISTINGVINHDQPIVPKETLVISGSLIAAGLAMTPLLVHKIKIGKDHWRIMILDFTD